MGSWADGWVASVVSGLADAAVAADAGPMSAYMRNQFPFLGVKAPARKAVVQTAFAAAGPPVDKADVVLAVDTLWARPEREYRYAGCLLAGRFAPAALPAFIDHVSRWITADRWWDTCDPLARACVGHIVRGHPELRATMDRWLLGGSVADPECADPYGRLGRGHRPGLGVGGPAWPAPSTRTSSTARPIP